MTTSEKVAVMEGWMAGKAVEWRERPYGGEPDMEWRTWRGFKGEEPEWNWGNNEYRIKPGQEDRCCRLCDHFSIAPIADGSMRIGQTCTLKRIFISDSGLPRDDCYDFVRIAAAKKVKASDVLPKEEATTVPASVHLAKCGVCDWREEWGSEEECDVALARHMREEHGEKVEPRIHLSADCPSCRVPYMMNPPFCKWADQYAPIGGEAMTCPHWKKRDKPKRYRPWTAEEAIGKVVRLKAEPGVMLVIIRTMQDYGVVNSGGRKIKWIGFTSLLADYEQADGSPCGVEVKE